MTMLVKEEVATSLAPASAEVISQPVLQQETISIKSAYFVGYFFEHFFRGFFFLVNIQLTWLLFTVSWSGMLSIYLLR